jgi:hypothetical protein
MSLRLIAMTASTFAASGQEKYTDAWVRLFRAYPRL